SRQLRLRAGEYAGRRALGRARLSLREGTKDVVGHRPRAGSLNQTLTAHSAHLSSCKATTEVCSGLRRAVHIDHGLELRAIRASRTVGFPDLLSPDREKRT